MILVKCKEFKDSVNRTIQFQFENDDKTLCFAGYWEKKNYEKIISVSTQIGCRTQCALFCNVQKFVRDITVNELMYQIDFLLIHEHLDVSQVKISMVKEGEPFDNLYIEDMVKAINERKIPYLKISSSMPYDCADKILRVFEKNASMDLELQLQISLSSTNDEFRFKNVRRKLMTLEQISRFGNEIYEINIKNDKKYNYITLSFTIYEESEFDVIVIKEFFDPNIFCIRIRDASNSITRGKNYTRLSESTYQKYKTEIEELGYIFIDGRSEKLAVDNNLTIGLYQLKEVLVK